jgi:hypothetical protein
MIITEFENEVNIEDDIFVINITDNIRIVNPDNNKTIFKISFELLDEINKTRAKFDELNTICKI